MKKLLVLFLCLGLLLCFAGCDKADNPAEEGEATGENLQLPGVGDSWLPIGVEAELEVDGEKQTVLLTLYDNPRFGMYYDHENFNPVTNAEDGSLVRFEQVQFSDVYVSVHLLNDMTADDMADQLKTNSPAKKKDSKNVTVSGVEGTRLHLEGDMDGVIYDVYLIDSDQGCFSITLCYNEDTEKAWAGLMQGMAETLVLR